MKKQRRTTKELTTLKIPRRYYHSVKICLAIVHYATKHGIKGDCGYYLS